MPLQDLVQLKGHMEPFLRALGQLSSWAPALDNQAVWTVSQQGGGSWSTFIPLRAGGHSRGALQCRKGCLCQGLLPASPWHACPLLAAAILSLPS